MGGGSGRDSTMSPVASDPVDAQDGADEPDNGAQEVEGEVCLPRGARVAAVDVDLVPVKDVSVPSSCQSTTL